MKHRPWKITPRHNFGGKLFYVIYFDGSEIQWTDSIPLAMYFIEYRRNKLNKLLSDIAKTIEKLFEKSQERNQNVKRR